VQELSHVKMSCKQGILFLKIVSFSQDWFVRRRRVSLVRDIQQTMVTVTLHKFDPVGTISLCSLKIFSAGGMKKQIVEKLHDTFILFCVACDYAQQTLRNCSLIPLWTHRSSRTLRFGRDQRLKVLSSNEGLVNRK